MFGISFTWMRNKIGPRIVPWGTPDVTADQLEYVPRIPTLCCLFVRNCLNHNNKGPSIYQSIYIWHTVTRLDKRFFVSLNLFFFFFNFSDISYKTRSQGMWYKHRSSNTTPTNPSHTRQWTYWTSFRSTRNIQRPSSSGALSHNTTTWWRDGMDQYIRPGSVWQYKPRVFSASVYIYSGNFYRLLVWLWTSGNHSKSCQYFITEQEVCMGEYLPR